MKNQLKRKLRSHSGETFAETLVALLVAALALTMLAGAMAASSTLVSKSREKLDRYYSAEEEALNAESSDTGNPVGKEGSISIRESSGTLNLTYDIIYYMNDEFSQNPVISYKIKD